MDNFNKITSLVRKQKPVRTKDDTDTSFVKKVDAFNERCKEAESIIEYWIYDAPVIASISGTTKLVKDVVTVDDNVIFREKDSFVDKIKTNQTKEGLNVKFKYESFALILE